MSHTEAIEILDISSEADLALIPPCTDARFDHRSCDYWEDDVRGSKASRPAWWSKKKGPPPPPEKSAAKNDNPFAREQKPAAGFNPFAEAGDGDDDGFNPFAPPPPRTSGPGHGGPRKLSLLSRGTGVFGSYAKVLMVDGESSAYAQFGPLSAYPRAQQIRELYPRLPQSPLPAVITCIATTAAARGQGLGARLVDAVCADLAGRGFAAIEAYPDLTLGPDEASSASPSFWIDCGFVVAAQDDRYPVLRRTLD